jgi:hypothetical protein
MREAASMASLNDWQASRSTCWYSAALLLKW